MNVLAIGAHPDDLEYGCAGTLIHHAQRGDQVYMMVVTNGNKGGEAELRQQEQLEAAKVIGAKDVIFGGYDDTRFECDRESIMRIEEVIARVEADVVYTHFGEDGFVPILVETAQAPIVTF